MKIRFIDQDATLQELLVSEMTPQQMAYFFKKLAELRKSEHWICKDLLFIRSSFWDRLLFGMLGWIPRLKSYYFNIDLNVSKSLLTELKLKACSSNDKALILLCYNAIENFNQIAPSHRVDFSRSSLLQYIFEILSAAIYNFDTFVTTRPNLLALFEKKIQADPNGFRIPEPEAANIPLDPLEANIFWRQRVLTQESRIEQRALFVSRYPEVTRCFEDELHAAPQFNTPLFFSPRQIESGDTLNNKVVNPGPLI